jgi:hypothetical protein
MILDDLAACSDKVRAFAKDGHVIGVPFRVGPLSVKEGREGQFLLSLRISRNFARPWSCSSLRRPISWAS